MKNENKGYSLAILNSSNKATEEKIFLKPMALYVPDIAARAVAELIDNLSGTSENIKELVLTVTNKNNGVSVDRRFATLAELADPAVAADAVKNLINTVRGYESDEETNVCGW